MEQASDRFLELISVAETEYRFPIASTDAVETVITADALLRDSAELDPEVWHQYLEFTGTPAFLGSLPTREHCSLWADTCFKAVLQSGYGLENMLSARVQAHPDKAYMRDVHGSARSAWTYAEVSRRIRVIAGLFLKSEPAPRVAIYSENSPDSACCDLACLVHRILDTPLDIHFDLATLAWIFNRLKINIAVTDTEQRALRLRDLRAKTRQSFRIFLTASGARNSVRTIPDLELLNEACSRVALHELDALLRPARSRPLTQAATVMFTSGSTGLPKGVVYTEYQIVTKRFARAAALPAVGGNETMLCYLPLYHTFGRYLELLGMLYWSGTYVFSGNPSFETLLAQFPEVQPTGMISIPLRWYQLREHCQEKMLAAASAPAKESLFRSVVGERLRWGLSAAGHLDSGVFRFFQLFGVDLCSGFGMTEATGGVTMTPPGKYVDGTVGIPLPGVQTRIGTNGELHISGPYIATYLDEHSDIDRYQFSPSQGHWIATGDVFERNPSGYLSIVDRIKDIYKNNRGQTVAPRRAEQKFDSVPGIKRAILIGDGRDSNVLLIVPDPDSLAFPQPSDQREYFNQIVRAANADLAPYERVVNFAVLDRDFKVEKRELTPKGSYRRRQIEKNFANVISLLYISSSVDLDCGGIPVRIPRWFFRNLGLLETDVVFQEGAIRIARDQRSLTLSPGDRNGIIVGDLEYYITGSPVDLGLFARQPRLWIGNPSLVAFCRCKDGWDLPIPSISPEVRLLNRRPREGPWWELDQPPDIRDSRLQSVHRLCGQALFRPESEAIRALEQLGVELTAADRPLGEVIQRRLEALAWHPIETLRRLAYRILIMDEMASNEGKVFPAFIHSGLTFLNEESIREIAGAGLGDTRLNALRQRLFRYRSELDWPGTVATRRQFTGIFDLLLDFARSNSSYYRAVRAELASWVLHRADPELAQAAEERFQALNSEFERPAPESSNSSSADESPLARAMFDDTITGSELAYLKNTLGDGKFLQMSIRLAFGEEDFELERVAPSGIWISRVLSQHQFDLYRAALNLKDGKHYDLLLIAGTFTDSHNRDNVYWHMALAEHPSQSAVIPRFGTYRPDLGAISVAFVNDLTAWEKIREYASAHTFREFAPKPHDWHLLFVRGMAAYFKLWNGSGRRILGGAMTPANVVVPHEDFRERTYILSLAGWKPYQGPLSLVSPLIQNFYHQVSGHFPAIAGQLSPTWIFEACVEALGLEQGTRFLHELQTMLVEKQDTESESLYKALKVFLGELRVHPYQPLPLLCAVTRYHEWKHANAVATAQARNDQIEQLHTWYGIGRFPEMIRYLLYRHTYFEDSDEQTRQSFDRLLGKMLRQPSIHAIHSEELSTLQESLQRADDLNVFSKMVFPRVGPVKSLELRAIGSADPKRLIVKTEIVDRQGIRYSVHDPVLPAEIGHLYRLYRESDHPPLISEQEMHLIVTDACGQVLGGSSYVLLDSDTASLTGIVVARALQRNGLGGALLEDFCSRMAAGGCRLIKTGFFLRRFYTTHNFQVDARWGGMVRHLG